jgi:hypothetical protein
MAAQLYLEHFSDQRHQNHETFAAFDSWLRLEIWNI